MSGFQFSLTGPLGLEIALGGLILVVFVMGLFKPSAPDRRISWVTLVGLLALVGVAFATVPNDGGPFSEEKFPLWLLAFSLDPLALFAKKLFLVSAAISVLATLGLGNPRLARRGFEYHVALLASLLGMLVLASARELILLFVAFELMSIPLYFLTGFNKSDETAGEGALKFFLVGTASSAVIVYGMSFVYGATGSTTIDAIPAAMANGEPLLMLGPIDSSTAPLLMKMGLMR